MPSDAYDDGAPRPFTERFVPADVAAVSPAFLAYARTRLPRVLTDLYTSHGLGWYGDQELLLVDPGEWMPVLQTWLGADVDSVPVAVTSFGHVYHVDALGRVECLDPHFVTNTVVADSVEQFFNEHLLGEKCHVADLRGPRRGAEAKCGRLEDGELYYFDPILPLGGQVSPDSLAKGDGVAQEIAAHEAIRVAHSAS